MSFEQLIHDLIQAATFGGTAFGYVNLAFWILVSNAFVLAYIFGYPNEHWQKELHDEN